MDAELPEKYQHARVVGTLGLFATAVLGDETKKFSFHNGTHPAMLASAARSEQMESLVSKLRGFLEAEAVCDEDGPCDVGTRVWAVCVYCRQGRHRSVATAELLANLLNRKGISTNILHHSLDGGSAHVHDREAVCKECRCMPDEDDQRCMDALWEK